MLVCTILWIVYLLIWHPYKFGTHYHDGSYEFEYLVTVIPLTIIVFVPISVVVSIVVVLSEALVGLFRKQQKGQIHLEVDGPQNGDRTIFRDER